MGREPRRAPLLVVTVALTSTGCLGISGIRNGPVRDRMRAATQVTAVNWTPVGQEIQYKRVDDVEDRARPFGFGIGGKTGIAYGGSEASARGGYAQDLTAFVVLALGRFYVAPQVAFVMNLHGSAMEGGGQTALALPLEVDAGARVADRMTLYAGGGRSLWGALSAGDLESSAGFWRGRAGTLLVIRNGSFHHFEITLRLEAFAMTGSGDTLDYDAVGGLLQFDFTGTGSGY